MKKGKSKQIDKKQVNKKQINKKQVKFVKPIKKTLAKEYSNDSTLYNTLYKNISNQTNLDFNCEPKKQFQQNNNIETQKVKPKSKFNFGKVNPNTIFTFTYVVQTDEYCVDDVKSHIKENIKKNKGIMLENDIYSHDCGYYLTKSLDNRKEMIIYNTSGFMNTRYVKWKFLMELANSKICEKCGEVRECNSIINEIIKKKLILLLLIAKQSVRQSLRNATNNNVCKKMTIALNDGIIRKIIKYIVRSNEQNMNFHLYSYGFGPCDPANIDKLNKIEQEMRLCFIKYNTK